MDLTLLVILIHPLSLCFLLFLCPLFLFRFRRSISSQSPNLPPSPPKLPILGNLHQLGTLVHHSFRDLSQKYGPIVLLHMGSAPVLVVSSAEMAKEILKNQDIVFANRPFTTAAKILLYGCCDLGFSPYGEYWRQLRKLCVLDLLSVKRVQSFKFIREEEVSLLIEKVSNSCKSSSPLNGFPINLSEMLGALSNNVVSRCTFGRKYEEENGKNRFGEMSKEMLRLMGAFSVGDLFPWLGWIDVLTGLIRRLKIASKELDSFLDHVIDEHLMKREDTETEKQFLLDRLLHAQRDNTLGVNLTRDNIKAIVMVCISDSKFLLE